MKRAVLLSLFSFSVTFISCIDDLVNVSIPEDALIRPIIFLSGISGFSTIKSDEITIQKIQIINDILIIDASYTGGCQIHSTELFSKSGFKESIPVQLPMKLIHHSYADTCTNIILERFYFDLKSIATLYKINYQANNGVVLLSIYDSDSTNYYLPRPRYMF